MDELEVTPQELQSMLADGETPLLLDVRNAWEHDICRLPGSSLIPLHLLPHRLDEIDRGRRVVAYCHTGARSYFAAQMLQQAGFDARSLRGGVDEWARTIDPTMKRY